MKPSKKVLVLGSDTRSFLSVVRSLGRGGITVDSAWTNDSSLARRSRYLRHVHDDLPLYSPTDLNWLIGLRAKVDSEAYDLVIPTCDPAILPLQAQRKELDPQRFYLLDDRCFELTYDKRKTYDLAVKEKIPVPDQIVVHSVVEGEIVAKRFGYPVILKPPSSFTLLDGPNKHFVQRAIDQSTLQRRLEAMLPQGGIAIQRYFRGIGVGVEVLAKEGQILAAFQHQRVHEPLLGGGSSYRKSAPLHPTLLDATRRLVRALDYTGVSMLEFRIDSSDRFILVEINGRFWGSLPLAIAAGADFPLWLYQMWVDGRQEFPQTARTGVYCRNLFSDLYWLTENVRADSRDPTLATLPIARIASELWHLITLREHFDTLVLDDPKPGIFELLEIGRRVIDYIHRRCWSSTRLARLRSLYRWKAKRRLRRAKKIAFVCKGNICRSPFAAEYAKLVLPHLEIRSAGYYPTANRSSPCEAVEAAASFGINLSNARSSVVDRDAVRDVDAILLFDYDNYVVMRSAYPDLAGKFIFLGLLDGGTTFIPDPFGGTLQDYVSTYKSIVSAIDRIAYQPVNLGSSV